MLVLTLSVVACGEADTRASLATTRSRVCAAAVSKLIPIAEETGLAQIRPRVAWNGSSFLVAWLGRADDGTQTARARRLEADGTPVGASLELVPPWKDTLGYPIGESLAVAAHDSRFAVTLSQGWLGSAYYSASLHYVDDAGQLVGAEPAMAGSFFDIFEPAHLAIADDARGWLLVWTRVELLPHVTPPDQLRFARIGKRGGRPTAKPTIATEPCGLGDMAVARFGTRHAILWGEACGNPPPKLKLYRLEPEMDVTVLDTSAGTPHTPALASSPNGGLAAWAKHHWSSTESRLLQITELTQNAVPVPGTLRTLWEREADSVSIAHDGVGYPVAWTQTGPNAPDNDALVAWVDPEGDSSVFELTTGRTVSSLDIASPGNGRSLVVLSVLEPALEPPRERLFALWAERSHEPCAPGSESPDGAAGSGATNGDEPGDESTTPGCAFSAPRGGHGDWLALVLLAAFMRHSRARRSCRSTGSLQRRFR